LWVKIKELLKTKIVLLFYCIFLGQVSALEREIKASSYQHSSPFAFRENKGQIANKDFVPQPDVLFQAKGKGVTLFLMKDRVVYQYSKITYPKGYQFHSEKDAKKILDTLYRKEQDSLEKQILTETFRMDMVFLNANKNPAILKENRTQDYENYYLAQCPEVATHVYGYTKITYKNLYPNIDWVIYTVDNDSNSTAFKYDFIVHPGGNPKDIQLQYTDIDSIQKLENGDLRIMNPLGVFEDQKPISFQGHSKIGSEFLVKNNIVSFHIDAYDHKQTLVIDPLNRIWATYYGGIGDDDATHCITDTFANVYIVGSTLSNTAISSNGFQNSYGGGNADAFMAKFNKRGIRLWATYYGGTDGDVFNISAIDNQNNIYACGGSNSTTGISFNGFQNSYNGNSDAILIKFNSAGLRIWGTYYGGTGSENHIYCSTDKFGNVYLCGITSSISNIASGGFQNTLAGGLYDAFLVKFNSAGGRIWSTYYGGNIYEYTPKVSIDSLGFIYLAGVTTSPNLAFNGYQSTINGIGDLFLVKFNSSCVRQWATYYGGNGGDMINNCVVDHAQNIYIAGITNSSTNFAFNGHQNTFGGGSTNDVSLVKFNSNGIPLWATYYGGSNDEWRGYCAIDKFDNVYLSGYTNSTNNIAFNGYMNTLSGSNLGPLFTNVDDAFLVKFNSSGVRQWGTYFGDSSNEFNSACTIDKYGGIYICGQVNSFWTHFGYNGHQNFASGALGYDGYLVKFQDCSPSAFSFDSTICVNHPIWFKNQFISDSGTYRDTLINATGCDSVLTLNLKVKKIDSTTVNLTVIDGPYLFNNINRYVSGVYRDTLINKSQCDSFIILNLTIQKKDTIFIFDTICDNMTVSFNNQMLNQSGFYRDTFKNRFNLDSFIFFQLTVNKRDTTHLFSTLCPNQSLLFNNQTLTTSGIYTDTFVNKQNCDSFIFLHLTIKDYTRDTQKVTFCGTNYLGKQSSGFYSDTFTTASCDSISVLKLTLLPIDTTYLQREICEGTSYSFNNQNLTLAVVYKDTLTNSVGCDSFIILDLKVNPKYAISYQQTICKGNSFLFDGVVRTQAGFYTQSIKTAKGCDSITTMELVILDTARFSESKTICAGETYKGYSTTGIHKEYRTAASGCDSVYTLNLTVLNASFNTAFITICKGSSYRGFKDTGVHYLYLSNQYGCDSTVEVHLSFYPPVPSSSKTITICKGEQVTINHQFIRTAGLYTDTLASVNGCDSLVYITLKVLELSPRLSLRDTSICVDDSLKINAPLGYLMYTWNNGTTLPYLWVSQAGQYSLKVLDSNRCIGYDTVQVARYPIQKLTITAPTEVEKADMFVAKAEGNAYKTLQWKPVALFECDTCAQNKLSLTSTTMLYLYYTDIYQCRYKDSLLIDVASYTADFEFPNAFSPNGDNKNDYFYPEGNYGTRAVFQIYNRWGEKVFESSVAKPRWDGTYMGEPQPAGVYSYYGILTLRSGKTVARKGTVTLIR
jgi:gliding motility-associated-like protein